MKLSSFKIKPIAFLLLLFFTIKCQTAKEESAENHPNDEQITPENALTRYLQNSDDTFSWEVEDSVITDEATIYQVKLTSQTWRDLIWQHSLSIVVPSSVEHDGALLFISGGSNRDDNLHPGMNNDALQAVQMIAQQNRAITALIKQVPNQPLFGDKYEDQIISYTFHNYQEDGDFTWPLLFPMVKSAVKAMDTIQAVAEEKASQTVNRFMLTGYSKRGWTTWLTGANDDRVEAIAPAVIDVLNMPVNVDYQVQTWGDYSVEIQDYVRLGVAQDINKPEGQELVTMVDPFSYRESLTMPKLILIGANDPYWPADAVKNYFDDLQGENYIFYTPNAGHDLRDGREATPVTSEFFHDMLNGDSHPEFDYEFTETEEGFALDITSDEPFLFIEKWSAMSEDRDFRDEEWTSEKISETDTNFSTTIQRPKTGFYATYLNVIYKGAVIPEERFSTRMFVAGNDSVYLKPMQ